MKETSPAFPSVEDMEAIFIIGELFLQFRRQWKTLVLILRQLPLLKLRRFPGTTHEDHGCPRQRYLLRKNRDRHGENGLIAPGSKEWEFVYNPPTADFQHFGQPIETYNPYGSSSKSTMFQRNLPGGGD